MMNQIKEQMKGKYPAGCAGILTILDDMFAYDSFSSTDALILGNCLVEKAETYKEGIAVRIYRECDQTVIFQYVSDDRGERNLEFAESKRNTVLKTGHCSLWAMAQEQTEGGLDDVFAPDSGCLPVGGAFPIYSAGQMVATITLSGLHNGNDHKVIVDAFCEILGKTVPDFPGKLV